MELKPHCLRVSAPSTTANLGPGFDCLGLALRQRNIWEVTLMASPEPGKCQVVHSEGGQAFETLPTDQSHLFFSSWSILHQRGFGPDLLAELTQAGLAVSLKAYLQTPLSRGLGSSAALRAASAEVYRRLTGIGESAWQLAAQLEGHPDNAAPAGLGGLVLGAKGDDGSFQVVKPDLHSCWLLVVAVPHFALPTEKARSVLPGTVPREDALFNLGRLGMLLEGLKMGDSQLLALGCQDRLHQKQRASLVPGLEKVMEAAKVAGASAAYLSGAGPSVAAFCDRREGQELAPKVGEMMVQEFARVNIEADFHVLEVDHQGLEVLESCPLA